MGILIFGAKALERNTGTELGTDIGKMEKKTRRENGVEFEWFAKFSSKIRGPKNSRLFKMFISFDFKSSI